MQVRAGHDSWHVFIIVHFALPKKIRIFNPKNMRFEQGTVLRLALTDFHVFPLRFLLSGTEHKLLFNPIAVLEVFLLSSDDKSV